MFVGVDFSDRVPYRKSSAGFMAYDSALLSKLWPLGKAWVGDMSFESAGYCSRYIVKKLLGEAAKTGYDAINTDTGEMFRKVPEFTRMSLKPGIGRFFFDKFRSDMFPHDRVVVRGKLSLPPRYYMKLYKSVLPHVYEQIMAERKVRFFVPKDGLLSRRNSKDIVTRAKLSLLRRDSI